jgi:hypothetical protein
MKPAPSLSIAFRRAATFFPTASIAVGDLTANGFCVASFQPPIVALTFAAASRLPNAGFTVSPSTSSAAEPPVQLHCSTLETKEIGDHVMLFAAIVGVEIRGGEPAVRWRRASFPLRLDYPYLASAEALESFVHRWLTGELPKPEWTHAAHVAVTGFYAFRSTPELVFADMKRGILNYAVHAGIVNGPDSGYHETLTRFWSNVITQAVGDDGAKSRLDTATRAVQRFGEDRDLPALYYSFDVTGDRNARREWTPPDLEPPVEWLGA